MTPSTMSRTAASAAALVTVVALVLGLTALTRFDDAPPHDAGLTDSLVYDGQAAPETGTLADIDMPRAGEAELVALQEAFARVSTALTAENVLQYGYDSRYHRAWIKITGLDIAKGLITVAVAYCSRYVPSALCRWAGDKLKYLARNIKAVSSHGAWLEISWSGSWKGGTW